MKYFISFTHSDGVGWIAIDREKPISSGSDLKDIQKFISETHQVSHVNISFWRLFE